MEKIGNDYVFTPEDFKGYGRDAILIAMFLAMQAGIISEKNRVDLSSVLLEMKDTASEAARVYYEGCKSNHFEWSIEGLSINDANAVQTILGKMLVQMAI